MSNVFFFKEINESTVDGFYDMSTIFVCGLNMFGHVVAMLELGVAQRTRVSWRLATFQPQMTEQRLSPTVVFATLQTGEQRDQITYNIQIQQNNQFKHKDIFF